MVIISTEWQLIGYLDNYDSDDDSENNSGKRWWFTLQTKKKN